MFGTKLSVGEDGQLSIEATKSSGKVREFKGHSANKHVDNYCVVDLETTGVFVNSADIIEISAIKVRNNEIVAEYSTLVNPKCHIPAIATAVNHITDEMVKNAPALEDVIDDFLRFVSDDVIVGYNNAGFDMNLLYDSVEYLRESKFSNDYLDMLHAVRRSLPELENAKLETVSNYYGLNTVGEHRALKDCYLTKAVYDKLNEQFGDKAFKKSSHHSSGKGMQYSSETLALQELQLILQHMLEDGQITEDEVNLLCFWLEEHRDLSGNYPFDKVFDALDKVLEDGKILESELDELQKIFAEVVDPVKTQSCHDSIPTLKDKYVCLTGEFDFGSKKEVEQLITDAGGIMDKSVKKATNYVVVGSQGSEAWKTGNYGSKIQKAMEWNAKGQNIKIIEEKDFIPMVQYLLENPDRCNYEEKALASFDWQLPVRVMLDEMVVEEELPENSLYLMANYGRDGEKITSYSVCIYEPDYPLPPNSPKDPRRNSIVINIKENGSTLELVVSKARRDSIGIPAGATIKEMKSNENNVRVLIPSDSPELVPYIKKYAQMSYKYYASKASSFGCCSLFNQCSDAKKCVHVNKLYSKACIYRNHLDAGRIFYGKNRNVD